MRAFNDVAPYTHLVDESEPFPLSFFETVVGMAYAAFADAPVDVAVVEVGMGGMWDATNVADGTVAVVLPISVDHAKYLGESPADIAFEKAGIIKPGATAVIAEQTPEVAEVLLRRAAEVGATVVREGLEFGVISRVAAVGGQVVSLQGLRGRYDDVFLPLYGAHQAQNAAVALAAVEALAGDQPLDGGPGAGGVRGGDLARAAGDHPAQPDDRARRGTQPARGRGDGGGAGRLVLLRPAHRRHRRDGRQGLRRGAGGVRAAPRPRDLHAELHVPRDAGRVAGRRRLPRCSDPTGSPSYPPSRTRSTRRRRSPRPARRSGPRSAPARCS